MSRLAFPAPEGAAQNYQCYPLWWPTDPVYRALISGALALLIDPANWEQINETDLTPEQAAAQFELVFDEWSANGTC